MTIEIKGFGKITAEKSTLDDLRSVFLKAGRYEIEEILKN